MLDRIRSSTSLAGSGIRARISPRLRWSSGLNSPVARAMSPLASASQTTSAWSRTACSSIDSTSCAIAAGGKPRPVMIGGWATLSAMTFDYEDKASSSRFVDIVWRTHDTSDGTYLAAADACWDMIFIRSGDATRVLLSGPSSMTTPVPYRAGNRNVGIRFVRGRS